jgi:hypothetical protein
MQPSSSSRCPACGGNFAVQYYQRRAADEPPDKVEFCPSCPLDVRQLKLIPSLGTPRPSIAASRPSFNKRSSTVIPDVLYRAGSRICILVEGAAAARCMKQARSNDLPSYIITSITIPVIRTSGKGLTDYYTKSIVQGEAHIVSTSDIIAPFVSVQSLEVYRLKQPDKPKYQEYASGYEILLPPIGSAEYTFLRFTDNDERAKLYIMLSDGVTEADNPEEMILSILEEVLATYGTETSIKSFVSPSIISSLYTQSAKAYDWPSAPETGYTYTWKPDGERFWYIRYGTVWLFSRRLLSGSISGWNLEDAVRITNKVGPILDVEVMIGHDPILIDVLALETGVCTPPTRSLSYVLDTFNRLKESNHIGIPIHVRNYYNTEADVYKDKDSLTYPVDGVVGIQDGSMTIIKLKTTKSIELKLGDDGSLLTSDDKVIAKSELQNLYEPGSIIELRISKEKEVVGLKVEEIILRTDKTKANSFEVCTTIVQTMSEPPEALERRRALVWCNTVRNKLHEIAAAQSDRGRMILDIGAGDGQEVSDYSDNPGVTYLLIEPDEKKCRSLMRRLVGQGKGTSRYFDGAIHLSHVVASLSTGNLRYAVMRATLADILHQENALKILRGCTRYCIASFSISHVKDDLRELVIRSNLDVIGCGYFYDNANSDGYLINESGVLMKRETNNESIVKWGSDKVYTEQTIYKHDFDDIFHVRDATELVSVFRSDNTGLLSTVSSNVYIISTRKYL